MIAKPCLIWPARSSAYVELRAYYAQQLAELEKMVEQGDPNFVEPSRSIA